MTTSLQEDRARFVRERVLDGVAALLADGKELTFAAVAKASAVPERTIYRYFPTREALLGALCDWSNAKIGWDGDFPKDEAAAKELVRTVFPGFARIPAVIRELLVSPGGLVARLSRMAERRRAATALVRKEVPGLDRTTERRLAALVHVLGTASTWQTLHDYWEMDGDEAGEAAALAIELLLQGARAKARKGK